MPPKERKSPAYGIHEKHGKRWRLSCGIRRSDRTGRCLVSAKGLKRYLTYQNRGPNFQPHSGRGRKAAPTPIKARPAALKNAAVLARSQNRLKEKRAAAVVAARRSSRIAGRK